MRKFAVAAMAALAGVAVAGGLAGCGGSGGGGTAPAASAPTGNVTRVNVAGFSPDALELALRVADGPWLSAARAAEFDADLGRIRAAVAGVADLHARPRFVGNNLIVGVRKTAPWLAAWEEAWGRGNANDAPPPATGEAALDALLATYDAAGLQGRLGDVGGEVLFLVRFAQPLNVPVLAEALKGAGSAHIAYAEPNGLIGDGDDIAYETQDGGAKLYTFRRGRGDCPAGCTDVYRYAVRLAPDGEISVTESGTPTDGGSGTQAD